MKPTSTIGRIKDVALRLMVEKGVAETTIRDLAREAGVSEGSLYRHYESKEDLVRDLFREHYAEFARRLQALQAGHKTIRAKLRAIVVDTCRQFDEQPVIYRFLLFAQHEAMRRFPPGLDSPVPVLRALIQQGLKTGEVKMKNPDLGAAMILGLLIQPAVSIVNGTLAGPLSLHGDDIAEACARILLK
jgi:AcrR family transcriptional regulator